ncbi:MAG: twin-arginine translocation signal domain-containing protein, partial [Polyangiaceae bacterium]
MMGISRRKFLAGSGLLGAGLATMPIFGNPFVRRALADIGNRYLVVVFLDGGNDGLNTVTPIDDGGGTLRQDYDAQRTSIGIDPADLLPLGN